MSLCAKRVYCLQLANGHRWSFVATEGTELWLDDLASIMELRRCELNEYPKLILAREGIEKYEEPVSAFDLNLRKALPDSGWRLRDHTLAYTELRVQFWYHRDVSDIIYWIGRNEDRERTALRMWNLTYFIHQREQFSGGFPFHAGLIEQNGQSILLAASGGVGKTTCCRRIPSPWRSPADDQTLVVRDDQGRYVVHPFPTWSEYFWKQSGRTWNVERYAPLSAVFFLQQAEKDRVTPVDQMRAAVLINEYATQGCIMGKIGLDKEERLLLKKRLFNNSCQLAKTVPAYLLEVSLYGSFWEEIEVVCKDFLYQCC